MIKWGRRGHDVLLAALFLALSPTLSGCSSDDEADSGVNGMHPVVLTTEMAGMTRATIANNTFVAGNLVNLRQGTTSKTYKMSNATTMVVNSGEPFYWKWNEDSYTFDAWSYGNNTTPALTMDLSDQSSGSNNEFLYAPKKTIGWKTTSKSLTFYHQLAHIVLNITYDRTPTTTNVVIGSASMSNKGTFTIPSSGNYGTWTTTSSGTIKPKVETAKTKYSAVIFPTASYTGVLFTITTSGTNFGGTFPYSVSAAKFEVGKEYTYNIKVENDLITVTKANVTVNPWQSE